MSKDQFALMLSETSVLISDGTTLHPQTYIINPQPSTPTPSLPEGDLHLSQLAIKLTVSVLAVSPSAPDTVKSVILPEILTLSKSPLLHGPALDAVLVFFKEVMSLQVTGMSFEDLLRSLLIVENSAKQAVSNQSRCVYFFLSFVFLPVYFFLSFFLSYRYISVFLSFVPRCVAVLCGCASESQRRATLNQLARVCVGEGVS
jgi:hypothetical protein